MIDVANFKIYAKLPEEDDSFLQGFLDLATAFCLRVSGLNEVPMKDGVPIIEFQQAVFLYALFLFNERDFPRPGVKEAVESQVVTMLAGNTDLAGRTSLSTDDEELNRDQVIALIKETVNSGALRQGV